jgi:hypothetical protein
MKKFMKISLVGALALAAVTFGAPQAQAWGGGWPIAAGVFGGLAVGTAVGATVASASTPVYYAAPPAVYAAPTYYAPAPAYTPAPAYAPAPAAVSVAVAPPYYYAPRAVYAAPYPYYYPSGRLGYGWGPRYVYGGRYYRR